MLAAVAAGYLLVMRRPDSLFGPVMWAEDGVILFKGAYDHGASSLFDGYNGQFLFVQHAVASLASPLPGRVATGDLRDRRPDRDGRFVQLGAQRPVGHTDLVSRPCRVPLRAGVHAGHGRGERDVDELPLVARRRRPRHRLPLRPTAARGPRAASSRSSR